MRTLLIVFLLINLVGCESSDIIDTAIYDLGNVRKVKLCNNPSSTFNKICTVSTTKKTIENLQVSKFPGGDVKYNDLLFFRYIRTSYKISIQYCKNNTCEPYASCYTFMPCYSEYYQKMELFNKE